MSRKLTVLLMAFLCICTALTAQMKADTVYLKLPDAEKMFLDSNFLLLAQKYNVDAQKALIIQARLWPNPNFSISMACIAER